MKKSFHTKKLLLTLAVAASTLSATAVSTDDLVYYDMSQYPLYGTLAPDASIPYTRLPDSIMNTTRPDLQRLGKNSTGLYIRFRSDAANIGVKYKHLKMAVMNHMSLTGVSGLDLYTMRPDSTWTTVSSIRPNYYKNNTTTMIMPNMKPEMREYMLYLPLYDRADSIFIGIDSTARMLPPALNLPVKEKPIVMYGTSILQGGCATRPGMVHTSMLSRMLDRQVINLGFSGNARLDPEIAQLIAQSDPSIVVIDALPNVKKDEMIEKLPVFYGIIRKAHPTVPIVFVENPDFPLIRYDQETYNEITQENAEFRKLYDKFVAAGDKNLHYFTGHQILGDLVEGTVDNYHLTDLGFLHFANAMYPLLNSLLK